MDAQDLKTIAPEGIVIVDAKLFTAATLRRVLVRRGDGKSFSIASGLTKSAIANYKAGRTAPDLVGMRGVAKGLDHKEDGYGRNYLSLLFGGVEVGALDREPESFCTAFTEAVEFLPWGQQAELRDSLTVPRLWDWQNKRERPTANTMRWAYWALAEHSQHRADKFLGAILGRTINPKGASAHGVRAKYTAEIS